MTDFEELRGNQVAAGFSARQSNRGFDWEEGEETSLGRARQIMEKVWIFFFKFPRSQRKVVRRSST